MYDCQIDGDMISPRGILRYRYEVIHTIVSRLEEILLHSLHMHILPESFSLTCLKDLAGSTS